MSFQYEMWPKDFEIVEKELPRVSSVVISRALIACEDKFLLTEPRKNWFGLPGGKLNKNEVSVKVNLISQSGLPGLFREIYEETGEDLFYKKSSAKFLGLSETWKIYNLKKEATNNINLIWSLRVSAGEVDLDKNLWIKPKEVYKYNIFPDGMMAIGVQTNPEFYHLRGGWIYPENKFVYMDEGLPISLHSSPPAWLEEVFRADTISEL